jgi:hypothetical protein
LELADYHSHSSPKAVSYFQKQRQE